ncbi:MAG: cytochrome c peroxidase [Holophagaceae bacterium]
MRFRPLLLLPALPLAAFLLAACSGGTAPADTARKIDAGRAVFFDESLSEPGGQSCASCHAPERGFTDPRPGPTSEGVVRRLFGFRNAPSTSYAAFAPAFHWDGEAGTYVGGIFLDGRAAGLEAQAQGPPLNPIEMHNPDRATYVAKVARASYAGLFKEAFGPDIFQDEARAFDAIAAAVAAFERSSEVSPFSSRYDEHLKGRSTLTAQERRGLALFEGRAGCAACHPSRTRPGGGAPLFTDFTYDNLGVPANPENPFYRMPPSVNPAGAGFADEGLALNPRVIADGRAPQSRGKFKVPTLRNLALTGPYMHNGVFTTLKEVVAFYNRRDREPARFGPPEVPRNVNTRELGDLGLSERDEEDLVAFLLTLTDGYSR